METLKLTVKNAFDRSILIEGRNFGMGFAMVAPSIKTSKKTFRTMQAFTACKDYLNDLVHVERHEQPLGKVYGFKHEYTGKFKDNDFVYLGAKIIHYKNGNAWKDFDKASKLMTSCQENLVLSINKLEDLLNLSDDRTILYGTTDTEFIFKLPKIWVQRGWLISLMTLWIRCFFNINSKDVKLSIQKMVDTHQNKILIHSDQYLFAVIKEFIKKKDFKSLLKHELPKLGDSPGTVHNLGISQFSNALKNM